MKEFFLVPEDVLENRQVRTDKSDKTMKLSFKQMFVYYFLNKICEQNNDSKATIGVDMLAKNLSMSKSTVNRCIKSLASIKAIEVEKHDLKGCCKFNTYVLNPIYPVPKESNTNVHHTGVTA